MKASYHVHNAELVEAKDWGATQTRLTFKGVSCGHGYGANETTIFMNTDAVKKMTGILTLGGYRARRHVISTSCCTVAQVGHFNFCPQCGKALR